MTITSAKPMCGNRSPVIPTPMILLSICRNVMGRYQPRRHTWAPNDQIRKRATDKPVFYHWMPQGPDQVMPVCRQAGLEFGRHRTGRCAVPQFGPVNLQLDVGE